jgi:hypothetical protein
MDARNGDTVVHTVTHMMPVDEYYLTCPPMMCPQRHCTSVELDARSTGLCSRL